VAASANLCTSLRDHGCIHPGAGCLLRWQHDSEFEACVMIWQRWSVIMASRGTAINVSPHYGQWWDNLLTVRGCNCVTVGPPGSSEQPQMLLTKKECSQERYLLRQLKFTRGRSMLAEVWRTTLTLSGLRSRLRNRPLCAWQPTVAYSRLSVSSSQNVGRTHARALLGSLFACIVYWEL
jgi:hypothetical protein